MVGQSNALCFMLWPLLIKIYAFVAAAYLAVTAGYITWRVWQKKRRTHSAEQ